VLEIRFHGRRGQGTRIACQVLAAAFHRAGWHVQALADAGPEGRAGLVAAWVRVDEGPIRLGACSERADYALVLDPALVAGVAPASLTPDGLVIVNSPTATCSRAPLQARTLAIDAAAIAEAVGLGPIVSTAMLGAFAGASRLLTLAQACAAVGAESPARPEANVAACRAGYLVGAELARALAGGRA
jgi:pyruvate ferredoxin oxidoreductase gamma subunit